ncbi:MAG: extracellular solute-binding protein [Anaerolineales bacterium]|nr:extracellular solute-binding protein [Anaerolineales bacterium]
MKKVSIVLMVMVLLTTALLSGCGSKTSKADLEGTTITYWHVFNEGVQLDWINGVIEKFNATNEYGITVVGMNQGVYGDIEDKVNAGIQSGDLPNVMMAYTNVITDWYSIGVVADISEYVESKNYGLTTDEKDAIYDGLLETGQATDGAQVAYPLSQSANVLVYNFTWAEELGYADAPATSAEFKEQVCAASAANEATGGDFAGTGGMVYYPSNTNYLHWAFAFGADPINADGTAYDFTTDAWVNAALYLNDLRDSGCIFQTESYPNPEQAQRKALVTMSSTAGNPYYVAAFEAEGNADSWGFLAAPGPDGTLAVNAFQQMVAVIDQTPEQNLASWLFIKFLTSPENQADWIQVSGYFPTQSTTEPLLADYAATDAAWASGLELASIGPAEPQTFPAWTSVRNAVGDAAAQLYNATSEDEVRSILADLTVTANALVKEIAE